MLTPFSHSLVPKWHVRLSDFEFGFGQLTVPVLMEIEKICSFIFKYKLIYYEQFDEKAHSVSGRHVPSRIILQFLQQGPWEVLLSETKNLNFITIFLSF